MLPNLYLAYRRTLSEGTEVFHNHIRQRWLAGDEEIVQAMKTWASYAEQGREAILKQDHATLARLIDANFDLRARLYRISQGNLEMIEAARRAGASANFAGSGGAIIGTFTSEEMYAALEENMRSIGVGLIRPEVAPRADERPV